MSNSTKVIVAGSRAVWEPWQVKQWLNRLCNGDVRRWTVVSGMCPGSPDVYAVEWAKTHGLELTEFPASWDVYGKEAGFIRNQQMADYADRLIAFWDGQSNGTRHMIGCMRKLNKPYIVILYGF